MSRGINSSLAREFSSTSVPIQLLHREGYLVVSTNNDELLRLILINLRFPLKLKDE